MSKIVSIDPASRAREQRKADLLEVLDEIRRQIEEEEITEFVAVSIDEDGNPQIHSMISDLISAVGLFEMGKHMIIQREAYGVEDE